MSTTTSPSSLDAEIQAPRKRRWPDLSAYGIHFGVTTMPNGESRLVMVDEQAAWPQLARQLGFLQSRWVGVYSKASPRLDFKGMSTQFPLARVVELTDDEIRARIRPLLLAHRDKRLSQLAVNQKRLSWHPQKSTLATAVASTIAPPPGAEEPAAINPEAALHQTIYVGLNFHGQAVFESGDGARFIKADGVVLASETTSTGQSPVFLRSSTDAELVQVASGMVLEIVEGKNLKSDDFIRYVEAAYGVDAANEKEIVGQFHIALDKAMRERVWNLGGASREVFDAALRLHDGRPSFWRADGEMPTPLPIAVAMQSIAASKLASLESVEGGRMDPLQVIDLTNHEGSHSWSLDATTVDQHSLVEHDVSLAGVFSAPIPEESISGVRITRSDSKALLDTLAMRKDKGATIFLMTTAKTGRLDTEYKRLISTIGQSHEVTGLIDLDASLFGAGNTTGSRIIVIGDKRSAPDYTFSVPHEVSVVYDYERLWNWAETVKAQNSDELLTFGDDGREENRWQSPYIPKSQVSEPEAMCPRNLLGPVRKALARVVESTGMDIDGYVCAKMDWTIGQLEERLSSEQVDAVALAIFAMDGGLDPNDDNTGGFTNADVTGLGKGRVAAVMAAYARKIGVPVMFMTEKSDLFTDFYRDVNDTGGMDLLGKPFIINNDLVIRDPNTNKVFARSPTKEHASEILACGDFPGGHDLVLATYSQFNREYNTYLGTQRRQAALSLREVVSGRMTAFDALVKNAPLLGFPDYVEIANQAGATLDLSFVESYERNQAIVARTAGDEALAKSHESLAVRAAMNATEITAALKEAIGTNFTGLKHQWAYSDALKGALLIMDESHVAAGDSSLTGANLQHMREKAGAVMYSSATFAKDVKNFQLYSRLFPSTMRVSSISETLTRGGEPMQEIVSAMLAEDGRLIRREHDLSSIEFKVLKEDSRKDRNISWANNFAEILAAMSHLSGEVRGIADRLNDTEMKSATAVAKQKHSALLQAAQAAQLANNSTGKQKKGSMPKMPKAIPTMGVSYTNFSSKLYNLSRAFSMALSADLAADRAILALESGQKPVITVENTMETAVKELVYGFDYEDDGLGEADLLTPAASVGSAADDGRDLSQAADPMAGVALDAPQAGKKVAKSTLLKDLGRRVSFKDILGEYVDAMFGAWEYTYTPEGKIDTRKRISLVDPALQKVATTIRKQIAEMQEIPLSPIDLVRDRIAKAGFSIDEISGRTFRLTENLTGTHIVERLTKRNKQSIKNAFNAGEIDALILSKSGSTGISLHASRTFADQSQRVLIELQPAADIAQRLQFWGRVNRKGQVCSPIVEMLSSGLPAENRLIAMQNNKLRRMSANTNGSADNSAINENAPDIINKIGNEVCYRWMENNTKLAAIIGFTQNEVDEKAITSGTKFVDMLTGRLMYFPVDLQEKIYHDISTEFNALMEQFEMEGHNPLKAAEFDLRAHVNETKVIQVATGVESAFDQAVTASELVYDIKLPAIDRELCEAEAELGRIALTEEFGKNWSAKLIKEFTKLTMEALPNLLPRRFETIEQALEDTTKNNAVIRAFAKLDRFSSDLSKMTPGSLVSISQGEEEDEFSERERIFITSLKIPADNRLSLAAYKVIGYSDIKRKRIEVSLSSVFRSSKQYSDECYTFQFEGRSAKEKASSKEQFEANMDRFFRRNSQPFEGEAKRVILSGNLYRAAELADSLNSGQTVTYSDAKGVWNHAVLMPTRTTMNNVGHLPVIVSNARMILDAARDLEEEYQTFSNNKEAKGKHSVWHGGERVIVSDTFRNGTNSAGLAIHNYKLYVTENVAQLIVVKAKALHDAIITSPEIKALITGNAWGSQAGSDYSECTSAVGKVEEFLEEVLKVLEKRGMKILINGEMRPWYNEYMSKKTGLPNTAKQVEEIMADNSEEELTSLLAAP